MYQLLVLFHILVCVLLIIIVLLQSGKGGGIAGAFGGSGTSIDSIFGAQGTTSFLNRVTIGLAVLFMILCLVHSFVIRPDRLPTSSLEKMAKDGGGVPAAAPMPLNEQTPAPIEAAPKKQETAPSIPLE